MITSYINLDNEFGDIDTSATQVTISGQRFVVRRDLTNADRDVCANLIAAGEDVAALAMIVGDAEAVRLSDLLNTLPLPHFNHAGARLFGAAGFNQVVA